MNPEAIAQAYDVPLVDVLALIECGYTRDEIHELLTYKTLNDEDFAMDYDHNFFSGGFLFPGSC